MKLTMKELESEIALAQSLPPKQRKARLESLKSAEVVEVDDEGKETPIKVSFVDATKADSGDDDDEEPKKTAKAKAAMVATADDDEADEDEDGESAKLDKALDSALERYRKNHPGRAPFVNRVVGGDKLIIPKHVRRYKVNNFKAHADQERTPQERAYCFGMWAIAAATGNSRAKAFCEENGFPLEKSSDPEDQWNVKGAPHNESTNTVGGFLVPPDFDNDLIDLREQYGLFRGWARMVPMLRDRKDRRRRTGGLTANFVGEGTTTTTSRKSWDMVGLTAKKLMCLTTFTNELAEDAAINIGDDLAQEIAYAFANKEDDCGFNGDGSSTYGGIYGVINRLSGINGTDDGGGLVLGSGNAWSALTLADFQKVISIIPQYADTSNVAWYCHRTFWAQVMNRLELAAGGVTSTEIINGVRTQMFLGYPVRISQILRSASLTATIPCVFGDLRLSTDYGDRRSTAIAFSEHATVDGVSVFETDEIAVRGTERFDINNHDLGTATAAGPVVGLILQ